ncbi:MAG: hypothetical protein ACPLRM_04530, partial [Anaerolineae bacterium]
MDWYAQTNNYEETVLGIHAERIADGRGDSFGIERGRCGRISEGGRKIQEERICDDHKDDA